MATAVLSAKLIESLKPPPKGQLEVFDRTFPGFGIRTSHGGRKAWVLLYRINQKKRRLTLGTFPALSLSDARKAAGAALQVIQNGDDPARIKTQKRATQPTTFGELADAYLERYAKLQKRSWKNDELNLRLHILPELNDRKVSSIKRADVVALIEAPESRGQPHLARQLLAVIRKLFNWAIEKSLVDTSPASGIKLGQKPPDRARTLTADELKRLWQVWDSLEFPWGPYFKILLLTAQRRSEVAGMKWDQVTDGLWTIPAEENKSGRLQIVPLAPAVVSILDSLARTASPYVFPSRVLGAKKAASSEMPRPVDRPPTGKEPTPISGFSAAVRRVNRKLGTPSKEWQDSVGDNESRPIEWRLHDLRRTATSMMARLRFPPHVLSAILNHSPQSSMKGVLAVYNRYEYLDEKREALEAWATFLHTGVLEKPGAQPAAVA